MVEKNQKNSISWHVGIIWNSNVYKVLMEHNSSYSLELLSHLSDTFGQFQLVPCAWVYVQSLQSCLTLCNSVDCSPSHSSILGILQAKILECVATPSSRDIPDPGIEPESPALQMDSLPTEPPGEAQQRPYVLPNLKCYLT